MLSVCLCVWFNLYTKCKGFCDDWLSNYDTNCVRTFQLMNQRMKVKNLQ